MRFEEINPPACPPKPAKKVEEKPKAEKTATTTQTTK